MTDERIDKWRDWAEAKIGPEIFTMHLHRSVFKEIGQIVEGNGSLPPSYFWEYLRDTYATTQAVAVRRQAEASARVVSLARLLNEIRGDPARFTEEWFVGMWGWDDERIARKTFAETFGGDVTTHLDPAIPEADLRHMRETAASVKTYVDQHVAHSDQRPGETMPTFNDIDAAIDVIGGLFRKYVLLLTAVGQEATPIIPHDWKAIFREPWLPPRQRRIATSESAES